MLFRKPTVVELADEIVKSAEAIDQTLIAEILAELGTLSEEDARQLLVAELGRNPSTR
jgi:biotin synthase-like enzyme